MGVEVHKLTSNSHHKNILASLHQLRIQGQLCDVTVQVDDQGDVQEFQAHQVILAASSGYFKKILLSQNATKEKLLLSNMQSDDFSKFLEFVYSGKIEVAQDKIGDVQAVAQILDCESLSEICGKALSTRKPRPRRACASKPKPQDASGSTQKGETTIGNKLLSTKISGKEDAIEEKFKVKNMQENARKRGEKLKQKLAGCEVPHKPSHYSSNENLRSEESENRTEDDAQPKIKEEQEEIPLMMPLSNDEWKCDDDERERDDDDEGGCDDDDDNEGKCDDDYDECDDEALSIDSVSSDAKEDEEEEEEERPKEKPKTTSSANFVCNKCMQSFYFEKSYIKHISTCHGETAEVIYCCEVCQQTFANHKNLRLHANYVHSTERLFECDICTKTFKRKRDVAHHKRQVHEQKQPYVCPDCGKTLSCKASLVLHERTHTGFKPYECITCQARFSQKSALNTHQRTHTGDRPFVCDECGVCYSHKRALAHHKRAHAGVKPYKCEVCKKNFASKEYLKHHINVHTGSKPFKCDTCDRSFGQRNSLSQHLKIHTGERPYKCIMCGKQFTQLSALNRHQRIHTGEKPFMCVLCKQSFTDQSTFRRHTLVHRINAPWKTYLVRQDGKFVENEPQSPFEENAEPGKKTNESPSVESAAPAVPTSAVFTSAFSTPAPSSACGAGTTQTETTVTLPSDWTSHGAISLDTHGAFDDIAAIHNEVPAGTQFQPIIATNNIGGASYESG